MSYIIPPRATAQDYRKGVITQDELLKIAIENDATIARARRAFKQGEVVPLTAQQNATPDELLMDMGKQESDARSNIMRLGFRDSEAASIVARLVRTPDVLRALNINFPAIEADIKKRFNVKLLTPTFFLDYLQEYNDTLNAGRGLDVNSSASVRRGINGLVNTLNEIRQILPDPNAIERIINILQANNMVSNEILDKLNELLDYILYAESVASDESRSQVSSESGSQYSRDISNYEPSEAGSRSSGSRSSVDSYSLTQETLSQLNSLPSREYIDETADELESVVSSITTASQRSRDPAYRDVMNRVINIINSLPPRLDRPPPPNRPAPPRPSGPPTAPSSSAPLPTGGVSLRDQMEQRRQRIEEVQNDEASEASSYTDRSYYNRINIAPRRPPPPSRPAPRPPTLVREETLQPAYEEGRTTVPTETENLYSGERAVVSFNLDASTLKQIKDFIARNPSVRDNLVDITTGENIDYNNLTKSESKGRLVNVDDTNLSELVKEVTGRGIRKTGVAKKPAPLKKIKIGKGLSVIQQPTFKEFGKYVIHMPQLENTDILNVKYKSLGPIPKFKPVPVSDVLKEFLLVLLDTGKPNQRLFNQMEIKERKLFEDIAVGAGIFQSLELKKTVLDDEKRELERFEVLKGEVLSGNNNPKVVNELRKLVTKFINDGRIRRAEGMNLLMELSV